MTGEEFSEFMVQPVSEISRVTSSPYWVLPLGHHSGLSRPRRLPWSPGERQVPQSSPSMRMEMSEGQSSL